MAVTWQGPASITVTRSTRPSSGSKTCVIPSLRPSSPAIRSPPRGIQPRVLMLSLDDHVSDQLDLNVDARRQRVEALERVDGLRRGLQDVDQPLVGADLEVLTRVLVLERRADHAVDVLLGGRRIMARHSGAGALRRLD